jgi:hypothetical protein
MIVRQPEPRHRLLGAFQLAMHRGEATDAPDAADSAIAGAAFADMRVGSTDPWVLVMAAGACPFDAAQCDRAGAARDLGRLQPDNAAAWLPTLEQAVAARDDTAIDATLARMAAASHWTDAFADTVRVALDAFDAVASMAQGAALLAEASGLDAGAISKRRDPLAATYAMGVALAVSMPSLQPVSTACKDDVVDARARRAACRVVARHLMDSNTAVGQRLGAAQARRLAVDDAEREGIEAFVHRLDWQMEALVEVMRALDGAVAREITDNDLRFFRSWRGLDTFDVGVRGDGDAARRGRHSAGPAGVLSPTRAPVIDRP